MDLKAFRRHRLNLAAEQAGVDLLVATLPANIEYVSGYVSVGQNVVHSTQSYALYVPSEDRFLFAVSLAEVPGIVERVGEDAQIFPYGAFRFCHHSDGFLSKLVQEKSLSSFASGEEALIAAIRSTGKTKIALDESRITRTSWEKVANALPDCTFISGQPVFLQARIIKHPEEIAGIERAAEIAAESLEAVLKHFRPGMTELDLEWAYREEVTSRKAEPYFIVATGDLRAAYADVCNTDLVIQRLIRFDYGCIYNGYRSDIARTAVIGEPDQKTKTYYNAVLAGTREAIKAMKPGVPASEIFHIAVEVTRRNGIPHYARHHCGHGIGLEAYDMPSIAPSCDIRLEKGMVCCIETPYYELGWGGVQIENTVEVTETGTRYLDKSSDELIVLA